MRNRIFVAAAASGLALAAVVGVALGVGHDEPRLVRTAGVSAPLEETSTTSRSLLPAPANVDATAAVDKTLVNHETRIQNLELTTTTTAASPQAATPAPGPTVADPTTTTTSATPPTTQAPTTTTTFRGAPWWCPVQLERGQTMVPCDSTTTTSPAN